MASILGVELNALIALEAVGRLGTVVAAASEMGVSPGAVSQQIKKAEAQIGKPLFYRTATGLRATPTGEKIFPALTAARHQIADGIKASRSDDDFVLNITMGSAFASNWLVPRLARFGERYPDYQLRFIATSRFVDFSRGDVDVGIRLGQGGWQGLHCERLLAERAFPVCAPRLAPRLSQPRDLAAVPILFDERTVFPWSVWLERAGLPADFGLSGPSFTDPMLAYGAAIAGQGVLMGWSILTRDALNDGRLTRPFSIEVESNHSYWLVVPHAQRRAQKVRIFRDWIMEELARDG